MNISAFGDLKWMDKKALEYWQDVHNTSHWNLGLYASEQNKPVSMRDLTGPIDQNWMNMHAMLHSALSVALLPADQSTNMVGAAAIDTPMWTHEAMFYQWQLAHNALHRQLEYAAGLT